MINDIVSQLPSFSVHHFNNDLRHDPKKVAPVPRLDKGGRFRIRLAVHSGKKKHAIETVSNEKVNQIDLHRQGTEKLTVGGNSDKS